jgi:hypothetical protein
MRCTQRGTTQRSPPLTSQCAIPKRTRTAAATATAASTGAHRSSTLVAASSVSARAMAAIADSAATHRPPVYALGPVACQMSYVCSQCRARARREEHDTYI